MFMKEINPYPISDKVRFRNVDKTLVLTVRAEATTMVMGLKRAQAKLSGLSAESSDEERKEAAFFFAETIFGNEQAEKLMNFYNNEPLPVITACGSYFNERLGKIVTKAQKIK